MRTGGRTATKNIKDLIPALESSFTSPSKNTTNKNDLHQLTPSLELITSPPFPAIQYAPLKPPASRSRTSSKQEAINQSIMPCASNSPQSRMTPQIISVLPSYLYDPNRQYPYRLTANRLSRNNNDDRRHSAVDQWYRQSETHEQLAVQGPTLRTYYRSENERDMERRRAEERWWRR